MIIKVKANIQKKADKQQDELTQFGNTAVS